MDTPGGPGVSGGTTMNERERDRMLSVLNVMQAQRNDLDFQEHAIIAAARGLGATWKQVADSLGLDSPQAAQQRHERLARRTGG